MSRIGDQALRDGTRRSGRRWLPAWSDGRSTLQMRPVPLLRVVALPARRRPQAIEELLGHLVGRPTTTRCYIHVHGDHIERGLDRSEPADRRPPRPEPGQRTGRVNLLRWTETDRCRTGHLGNRPRCHAWPRTPGLQISAGKMSSLWADANHDPARGPDVICSAPIGDPDQLLIRGPDKVEARKPRKKCACRWCDGHAEVGEEPERCRRASWQSFCATCGEWPVAFTTVKFCFGVLARRIRRSATCSSADRRRTTSPTGCAVAATGWAMSRSTPVRTASCGCVEASSLATHRVQRLARKAQARKLARAAAAKSPSTSTAPAGSAPSNAPGSWRRSRRCRSPI